MGSSSTRNWKISREGNRQTCGSVTVMDWLCRMSFKLEHSLGVNFFPNPLGCRVDNFAPSWVAGQWKVPPLMFSCTKFTLTRSADAAKGAGYNMIGCCVEKHYIYYCSWENLERLGGLHSSLIPKGNLGINQGELELNFEWNWSYPILLSVADLNSKSQWVNLWDRAFKD